eukprot:TRINITY_DN16783_c0_g3_i1.p1 TRINITY_DN16783_c0_g3~~TRINITY_DN16783_c0_g3_i1.p1  ORF type:complete len:342 (+),score=79.24 TRINITY_DN16783_c0_g3_i1:142-1026(+)
MPGVQQTFATSLGGSFPALVHLLPEGKSSNFGVGEDLVAGATLQERMAIFGQLGDVYIAVEGGPGVATEAADAFRRGALVLPMMSTGGASSGMFSFPAAALERPDFATEEQWSCLREKVAPEVAAEAVVEIIRHHVKIKQVEVGRDVEEAEVEEEAEPECEDTFVEGDLIDCWWYGGWHPARIGEPVCEGHVQVLWAEEATCSLLPLDCVRRRTDQPSGCGDGGRSRELRHGNVADTAVAATIPPRVTAAAEVTASVAPAANVAAVLPVVPHTSTPPPPPLQPSPKLVTRQVWV